LGAYAIGISVLASAYTMQGSLITLPYSIQLHRPLGTPAEHAGSSLAHSAMFSGLATLLLAVAALGLSAFPVQPELMAMTWALAAVMPFALLREFGRRFAFSHLRIDVALMLDVAVAVIQLAMLAWLGWTGQMSAVTASGTIGVSCGLAALGWLYFARGAFSIRLDDIRATMKQSWGLGKWLFVNQIMVQVQRYITYWLSAVMAGAAVTGIYAACMSVVAFANPLVYGLFNILAPRSVLAWKEGGGPALRRQAIQHSLLFIAVMAPFCIFVLFAGDEVMRFLYHGQEYEGHGYTVTVLALATLLSAAGMPASNALAAMERPRVIVGVGGIGAALTVLLVWLLMTEWGLLGAAYGLLWGNAASSVGLWVTFLVLVPRACDRSPAVQVLRALTQTADSDRWAITRLGEGDHATVYAAQSKDRQAIWHAYDNLVIKLYKPEAQLGIDLVDAQFDALSRMHAVLDGRTVNGWKITTPKPIYVCKSPLALVMTAVSAKKDLKSCAATDDDLTPEVLDAVGRAFAAAMQESWSRGQLHGDLALQNILYDIPGKNLSLIDPGTRECCRVCNSQAGGRAARLADRRSRDECISAFKRPPELCRGVSARAEPATAVAARGNAARAWREVGHRKHAGEPSTAAQRACSSLERTVARRPQRFSCARRGRTILQRERACRNRRKAGRALGVAAALRPAIQARRCPVSVSPPRPHTRRCAGPWTTLYRALPRSRAGNPVRGTTHIRLILCPAVAGPVRGQGLRKGGVDHARAGKGRRTLGGQGAQAPRRSGLYSRDRGRPAAFGRHDPHCV
jgi:O-antigen/teichoic acid export membrane protein